MRPTHLILLAAVALTSMVSLGCSGASASESDEATGALEADEEARGVQSLGALANAKQVVLVAEDATRTIAKSDADFAAVLKAVNLEQKPFDSEDVPVAMCPSTHAARFIGDDGKVAAQFGLVCGAQPGAKNDAIITFADRSKLGIVVDGAALSKLTQSAP